MYTRYIAETAVAESLVKRLVEEVRRYEEGGQGHTLPISCIYSGRNKLYKIISEQGTFVVKCFRRPSFLQGLYYSYWGRTKAERSHLYSLELRRRGIGVPETLGYVLEMNTCGFLARSYHINRAVEGGEPNIHMHSRGWAIPAGFMSALAKFLVQLHRAGVEHLDLSPGNVLYYVDDAGNYQFSLVDLNRMVLHTRALSLAHSIRNMNRLIHLSAPTRQLAYFYALERGEESSKVINALEYEVSRFWRSKYYKLSYRYARRAYATSFFAFLMVLVKYKWVSRWGKKEESFQLYQKYFQAEDIRHDERHRQGFSYQYTSAE